MVFGKDNLFLGAYWGTRQETVDSCVDRLGPFLNDLSDLDRVFHEWESIEHSEELYQAPGLRSKLHKWLLAGVARRDTDRGIMADLGFSTMCTAKSDLGNVVLHVHCGCYCKWVPNVVTVYLPPGTIKKRFSAHDRAQAIMEIIVKHWDPDRGVIGTTPVLEATGGRRPGVATPGWVTFLSSRVFHRIKEVDKPAELINLPQGQLIFATPRLTSLEKQDEVDSLRRVAALIRQI